MEKGSIERGVMNPLPGCAWFGEGNDSVNADLTGDQCVSFSKFFFHSFYYLSSILLSLVGADSSSGHMIDIVVIKSKRRRSGIMRHHLPVTVISLRLNLLS